MIFTPRSSIDLLGAVYFNGKGTNPAVNTVILYKGYDISIAMDSNHSSGDLARSEIMVWHEGDTSYTSHITAQFLVGDETRIDGAGEILKRIMDKIDTLTTEVL